MADKKPKKQSAPRKSSSSRKGKSSYLWLIVIAFAVLLYWSYSMRKDGGSPPVVSVPAAQTIQANQATQASPTSQASQTNTPQPASAPGTVTLTVAGWNAGSGGAQIETVAARVAAFDGVDLWGMVEVQSENEAQALEVAAEVGENANFERIVTRSGSADRMVILYDADRFEKIGQDELEYINLGGSLRAPLLVHLHDRLSGQRFAFMVNHLFRGNDSDFQRRLDQSALLNEWAIVTPTAAIAVGDYNFDWGLRDGDTRHDQGYDFMTADGEWRWVRPPQLVTTQCSGWPCRYNSVLDFVFVANGAQAWTAQSQIIIAPNDFPDDDTTTDHRPVLAWFELPVLRAP